MRSEIVVELKLALRERGLTYADVARQLHLSIATVKRLFSRGDLSLERVDRVCELLGIELSGIVERALEHRTPQNQLTAAQEREITADPKLFMLTWLILGRTPYEDIMKLYRFSAAEAQRYLIKLDRLKVIELQPGNRVRLLVNPRFSWIRGGPVQHYIHQKPLKEFFTSRFSESSDEFFFHGDAVSEAGFTQLRRVLQNSARECMEILERDRSGAKERCGAAFVLALRPWEYSGFLEWRRDSASAAPADATPPSPGRGTRRGRPH
jgi:transcriptional regulator with XRE-family HTH domain